MGTPDSAASASPASGPSGHDPAGAEPSAPDRAALLYRFESLGGGGHGCEFGLFQRECGAEPLSLLRFTDLDQYCLMAALETDLAGVGEPEYTTVFRPGEEPMWWTMDTRYHMASGSSVPVDVDLERATRLICQRQQFLRRKLIEDLRTGDKIFVYKNMFLNLPDDECDRLHNAVRRYGASTLLYVRYEDEAHPNGTVERRPDGMMTGYIDRFWFSPDERNLGLPTESWYAICARAAEIFDAAS